MTNWCVWMRFVHKNGMGWGLVAHELTQDEAEWMAGSLLQPARAMPMRQTPEGSRHQSAELEKYHRIPDENHPVGPEGLG